MNSRSGEATVKFDGCFNHGFVFTAAVSSLQLREGNPMQRIFWAKQIFAPLWFSGTRRFVKLRSVYWKSCHVRWTSRGKRRKSWRRWDEN